MQSEMERLNRKIRIRRRRRIIKFILISPVVAFLCIKGINALFKINCIAADNETFYSNQEIITACGYSVGDGLFSVNTKKVETSIPKEYPYIKEIDVLLHLPDKIYVKVEKTDTSMVIEAGEGYLYVDKELKVLESRDNFNINSAILIKGMVLEDYEVGKYLDENINIEAETLKDMISLLTEFGLYDSASIIDLTRKYDIKMILNDIITIHIGNTENLEKKIDLLKRILDKNDVFKPAEISVKNYKEGRYRELLDFST